MAKKALAFVFVILLSSGSLRPGLVGQEDNPNTNGNQIPIALPLKSDSIRFMVVGDTGTGKSAQRELAKVMVQAYAKFPFEFVLLQGDNLYGGENPGDYRKKFEEPYKALLDAGVKFYAALGNHDEPAQAYYKLFNMDGKRFYSFKVKNARFFALDTTYMSPEQLKWIQDDLKGNEDWKICFFHHPLYSSGGRHGSDVELRKVLEPLFVENGVDVVFSGHEHFYERIKPQKSIHYFISGAGGKLRKGDITKGSGLTAAALDTDYSFILLEISGDELYFQTLSLTGRTVDSGVIVRREKAEENQRQMTQRETETDANKKSEPQKSAPAAFPGEE